MAEATALGAAMAAGCAEGIGVWDLRNLQSVPSDTFQPSISEDGEPPTCCLQQKNFQHCGEMTFQLALCLHFPVRDMRFSRWKMAIARSLNWQPETSSKHLGGKLIY
jgi:glycerol kinase